MRHGAPSPSALIPEKRVTRAAGIEMDPRTNGAVVYENMETSLPRVRLRQRGAGHDLVDFVTRESERAGAPRRAPSGGQPEAVRPLSCGRGRNLLHRAAEAPGRRLERGRKSFRVRGVMDGKRVTVRDAAGALLASYPREHMAPGEMERICCPKNCSTRLKERFSP